MEEFEIMEDIGKSDDSALLERYAQGDPEAFEVFFLRHRGRVYQYIFRKVHQPEVALELTQEVFFKLHAKIHLYQAGSPALNWFFTLVHNTCVDFLRRKLLEKQYELSHLSSFNEGASPSYSDNNIGKDGQFESERLLEALNALSDEQRKIVEARALEERSFASLSDETGKSESALRKVYSRALQKLRNLLSNSTDSGEEK
jgi:RNA polymerase sigma-70 factor (ECF subfamily)